MNSAGRSIMRATRATTMRGAITSMPCSGATGGRSLLFNSHIDTMPPGDLGEWRTPPFEPSIQDGKLYGLGSADMKGGLMASAMAVKLLKDAGYELPGDVMVTSVCDEEGGGNGSMVAAMNGLAADGVINCEGTDDELVLAHMGFVFFRVDFVGKANHSGAKWLGVSAIEKAWKVINALSEMEHQWLLEYRHPLLPAPNMNIGVICGGTAGSTVAGECYFETCIHYLPGQMSYEQVVREFHRIVEGVSAYDPWLKDHPPKITIVPGGRRLRDGEGEPVREYVPPGVPELEGQAGADGGFPGGERLENLEKYCRLPHHPVRGRDGWNSAIPPTSMWSCRHIWTASSCTHR